MSRALAWLMPVELLGVDVEIELRLRPLGQFLGVAGFGDSNTSSTLPLLAPRSVYVLLHPIELDRVLGMEEAYAGSSFLTVEDRGTLVRQPARLDHGRRDADRRARLVRLRRRRCSRATRPHPRRRHLPELPDQPGDGAGRRTGLQRHQPRGRLVAPAADPHDEHLARAARGLARRDHRRHEGRHLHGHEPVVVDRRQAHQLPVRVRDRLAGQGRQARRSCTRTRTTRGSRRSSGARATPSAAARSGRCGARPTAARASPDRSGRVGHGTSPARFRDVQVGVR